VSGKTGHRWIRVENRLCLSGHAVWITLQNKPGESFLLRQSTPDRAVGFPELISAKRRGEQWADDVAQVLGDWSSDDLADPVYPEDSPSSALLDDLMRKWRTEGVG